jgi:glycosyltransferase involved in cell wall biosynthesis
MNIVKKNIVPVFILSNTLKSGGSEKQSIYLTRVLSAYYDVKLIVYYGSQYDGRMMELIDGYNVKVVWLKGTHLKKIFYLYRLFHLNKGGVVISYLATTNLINAVIGTLAGIRIKIGGIRNSKLKPYKHTIQKMVHNHLLTCSVFNNKQGVMELSIRGFNKNKSVVIHNGIEVEEPEKKTANHDTITILTVSRFVEQKDYKTAIIAFQKAIKLSKIKQKVQYVIIGHGPLEMELREFVKECNLTGQIEFVINPANVNAYYKEADIYLSTSLFEGLSNSIMEAMSFSLPVVATDVGDNNLLVQDQQTGFLVKTKVKNDISQKLKLLIENPKLREDMGKKGYIHIKTNFSIEKFSQAYIQLIEKLRDEKK